MLALAQTPEEVSYKNLSKQELENLGFTDVKMLNLKNPIPPGELDNAGLIYVCGGNTFSILKRLRELNLDQEIIDLVKEGTIYVGVSAGSIIAGPSIEIAGWGSEGDQNEVNLTDLTGFNLTNVAVFPHYHEELADEVKEFKKKVAYPVVPLTNEQLVFIEDNNYQII